MLLSFIRLHVVIRAFLSGCILFCCSAALAEISEQAARDFALEAVHVMRSDNGFKKLEAYVSDAGGNPAGQIGWAASFECEKLPAKLNLDSDFSKMDLDRIFIRVPDPDNPMQNRDSDLTWKKCLVPPEKMAVIYFSNRQDDVRAVFIMPLVSDHGKIRFCPIMEEKTGFTSKTSDANGADTITTNKNLSTVPGVEITKVGDDDNSYGFPWPQPGEKPGQTFDTEPKGCSLRQIILYAVDEDVWVKGFNYLPTGRFRVHCKLLAGESETAENKLLKAIAGTFGMNIRMEENFLWDGYQVTIPGPLPDCFKVTKKDAGQAAMHGEGDYEGYSLDEILSHALYKKPMQLLSTNDATRYDVKFEVWPEKYGEMAALQKLGFTIVPAKIPEPTWVISPAK